MHFTKEQKIRLKTGVLIQVFSYYSLLQWLSLDWKHILISKATDKKRLPTLNHFLNICRKKSFKKTCENAPRCTEDQSITNANPFVVQDFKKKFG